MLEDGARARVHRHRARPAGLLRRRARRGAGDARAVRPRARRRVRADADRRRGGVPRRPRRSSTGRSRCSPATGARGPVVLAGDENEIAPARRGPSGRARRDVASRRRAGACRGAGRAGGASAPARRCRPRRSIRTPRRTSRGPRRSRRCSRRLTRSVVKIAFDTGHCVVGGGDPVEFARAARDRIAHLHLKDVDPRVLERVRSQELTVEEAWEQGLFCEFGDGRGRLRRPCSRSSTASAAGRSSSRTASPCRSSDLPAVRAVEERNLRLRLAPVRARASRGRPRAGSPGDRARARRDADRDRAAVVLEPRPAAPSPGSAATNAASSAAYASAKSSR